MLFVKLTLRMMPVAACLAGASLGQTAQAQVPAIPGWDLVWSDDFDTGSLDTARWTALNRKDSFNNEKQYYHPNQVAVTGDNLELTAIDVPRQGKAYQSGLITSNALYGIGRFEARIDLPTSQGMWPAFWLNANNVQWPLGGEIDIMENRGSQPNLVSSAYHWQTDPGPCCDQRQFVFDEYTATEGGQPVNFHAGFHTYAVEWEETSIRYYVDDNLYHTVTEQPNRPIIETPKNIILNLAVGGDFGGDPDGSTVFPQTMKVDYVRYWQKSTSPPQPSALVNGSFDDSGGTLNGWTTFGNSIPNVSAQSEAVLDGTSSLKIFGQFSGGENFSGVQQGIAVTEGQEITADASAFIRSQDTLSGKDNEVFMKLEYFSSFGAGSGSPDFLGETQILIADGFTAENAWLPHQIIDTAPTGSVEARLSFLFRQLNNHNGAIHIDSVTLSALDLGLLGDLNGDGFVGITDLNLILGAWNASITPGTAADPSGDGFVGIADLNIVLGNWNAGTPPATGGAIPEPGTLALLGFGGLALLRRRN